MDNNIVWYIENEEGTHALIGEFAICGQAFDELNGYETTSSIVTCPQCGDRIRVIRRIHTRRPTKHAPDVVESAASVSISTASEVSASEAESNPATTQVM